jgi:hypothetical protein
VESTTLTHVWSEGMMLLPLTAELPYQVATYESSYVAGLRVTAALTGDPRIPPTNDYTCFDTPQDSITRIDYLRTPLAPGLYPRWAMMTSAGDLVDGSIARILDYQCVNVGGFAADDDDGDCLQDAGAGGTDADDTNADQDGDGVPDGIEAASGSSVTAADEDGDGAGDYVELAQMTDPNDPDTDGDGSMDKPDDGADEDAPTGPSVIVDTTADDNCPSVPNASQANSEGVVIMDPTPDPTVLSLAFSIGDGTEQTTLAGSFPGATSWSIPASATQLADDIEIGNQTAIPVVSTAGFHH